GLDPQGQGALQLAFEQLKRKLSAEGLFDQERKRALPPAPQRVGIVTSSAGAALRDMLKVLRRHPRLEVVVAPALVQGDGAGVEIAVAVDRLSSSALVDVLILARGGGSLEDLWAFNEEVVARAVAASPIPIITGVGHEVDFTIADFVADLRAATPTQAAELVVARLEDQERRLDEANRDLGRGLMRHLQAARSRLGAAEGSAGLARLPQRIRLARMRLDALDRLPDQVRALAEKAVSRLRQAEIGLHRFPGRVAAGGHRRLIESRSHLLFSLLRGRMAAAGALLSARERALQHLSPRRILERGYSITTVEGSKAPLRDPSGLHGGEILESTLARGNVRSLVAKPEKTRKTRKLGGAVSAAGEIGQRSLFEDGGEK
ncbi:MAG: exodeoxyribonuclease VII large subunit, partial [Thermoanaerobaculales bacterium]|nr:exodeoxyribonuclease VII large subunit [Thermoanaerobaculales bacterium]